MVKSKKIHYTFQNVSTPKFYLRILLLKFIKVLAVFFISVFLIDLFAHTNFIPVFFFLYNCSHLQCASSYKASLKIMLIALSLDLHPAFNAYFHFYQLVKNIPYFINLPFLTLWNPSC